MQQTTPFPTMQHSPLQPWLAYDGSHEWGYWRLVSHSAGDWQNNWRQALKWVNRAAAAVILGLISWAAQPEVQSRFKGKTSAKIRVTNQTPRCTFSTSLHLFISVSQHAEICELLKTTRENKTRWRLGMFFSDKIWQIQIHITSLWVSGWACKRECNCFALYCSYHEANRSPLRTLL